MIVFGTQCIYVCVQHVWTISSDVRTQVAVLQECIPVMVTMTAEIGLMKGIAVSDFFLFL